MMMSIEDFEYYNNYTYEKQKARDEREKRERRKSFLIKNYESDSRYARELRREFGIQLH